MNAAALHAKFFPPARPICRYTRAEIDHMAEVAEARKERARRQRIRHRPAWPDGIGKVYLAAPVRDCKIIVLAATMYGVSVRDFIGPQRTALLTLARAYAATRLHDELGRSYVQIGNLLHRDHTTILSLLGRLTKNAKRKRYRP